MTYPALTPELVQCQRRISGMNVKAPIVLWASACEPARDRNLVGLVISIKQNGLVLSFARETSDPTRKATLAICKMRGKAMREKAEAPWVGPKELPPFPSLNLCVLLVDRHHPAQAASDGVGRLSAGAEANRAAAIRERDGALRKLI